jgi:hypothetical protein
MPEAVNGVKAPMVYRSSWLITSSLLHEPSDTRCTWSIPSAKFGIEAQHHAVRKSSKDDQDATR